MENTFFTIFTSVYNRKHTVHRVWDSLINQTNKNFEWLIIDNGSEDDIGPLLNEYKSKADFEVKIYVQENKGKTMAFNRAIDLAEGELIIPADSDDSFEYNTIERFSEVWAKYKADDVSGVTGLCKYDDGTIVGDKFPTEGISTYDNMHYKHGVKGEKWGCIRVDILKKYRYPTQFDVKYIPDDYVWAQIGYNYKTVFINEPLRLYFQDSGNQITKNENKHITKEQWKMKNFITLWRVNYLFPKMAKYLSTLEYFRVFIYLWQSASNADIPISKTFGKIESAKHKIIALLLLIPAYLLKIFNIKLNFLKKN